MRKRIVIFRRYGMWCHTLAPCCRVLNSCITFNAVPVVHIFLGFQYLGYAVPLDEAKDFFGLRTVLLTALSVSARFLPPAHLVCTLPAHCTSQHAPLDLPNLPSIFPIPKSDQSLKIMTPSSLPFPSPCTTGSYNHQQPWRILYRQNRWRTPPRLTNTLPCSTMARQKFRERQMAPSSGTRGLWSPGRLNQSQRCRNFSF